MPSCFFFNDTATTEIYTLSLHDALPIFGGAWRGCSRRRAAMASGVPLNVPPPAEQPGTSGARVRQRRLDRKSTRLNSSHANISDGVFCLKKKRQDHIAGDAINHMNAVRV